MSERPILSKELDSKTFLNFYYLKEEYSSIENYFEINIWLKQAKKYNSNRDYT